MFKLRSVLIAAALVALLSVANWQASFARVEEGELSFQSNPLVVARLICINNFVPNPEQTKCICPEGRHIDFTGDCKKNAEDEKEKTGPKPYSSAIFGDDTFQNMEQSRQATSERVLYTISGWFTVAALALSMVIARPKFGKKSG